jgi:hypothetical protein
MMAVFPTVSLKRLGCGFHALGTLMAALALTMIAYSIVIATSESILADKRACISVCATIAR